MLLEYNSFIKNNVIIQVINGPYWDYILEQFDFKYYNKDTIISSENKMKLREIENIVEKKLDEINPFIGSYKNEKTGQIRSINYDLYTTQHWYVKFLRKEYEADRYLTPGPFEGINIIYNNINHITFMIDTNQIRNQSRVMIKSKDASLYTVIVIFEKVNPKTYNITMQTQMKGKTYIDGSVDREVKLHPNGPLVK
jgi:hypothetical protein